MKKICLVIICMIILSGCNSPAKVVTDASILKRNGIERSAVPNQFFSNGSLKEIEMMDHQDFYTINEWYDEESVIYSVGEKGMTTLYLHNIFTGEKNLFYQTEEFITKMVANPSHTLFALQTLEQNGDTHLRILNRMGVEVFSWSKKVEDLQFMWNPYVADELIATEFLTFLEFQPFKIKIGTKALKQLPVHNPYVQWISEDELGYLNWNQNEPSLDAPLYIYNLKNQQEKKWLNNRLLLFSLKGIIITVSIDNHDLKKSLYSFYNPQTKEKITDLYIPVLNTFSESWWIPSHDYDDRNGLYYYMKPKRVGDITEYNEGFDLTVLSVPDNKEEVVITVENNVPIKLSPDGNWCLIGQQLEQIINVPNKRLKNLMAQ